VAKEPVVFFDDKTLKGLLYRVRPANSDVIILLATLVFTNTHPIDNLQLHFSTTVSLTKKSFRKSSSVTILLGAKIETNLDNFQSNGYRNVNPKMYNIGAFSPLRPVVKLNQLLLLGPLTGDIEKVGFHGQISHRSLNSKF
jgi:hypothetical protein